MTIKILVAAHKKYRMPADDVYVPVQVGAAGKPSIDPLWQRDDEGDNISSRNPNYCELTALYWAWKNLAQLPDDCIGLCHYRRYFGRARIGAGIEKKREGIFSCGDYENILKSCDVIVPEKRNYYIETVRSQYAHAHHESDLDTVEQIIREKYPDYMEQWGDVMDSTRLHILNMFVMRRKKFDEYCAWLFDILFTLEARIDIESYDGYNSRLFGFLSERLFNVWLAHQRLRLHETPVVMLEPVNWPKKIVKFLERKFVGKR